MSAVVLAPLVWKRSPNFSSRRGEPVSLLTWHETAGAYAGAIDWLCTPTIYNADGSVKSGPDASAHLVVREDGAEVTQLVPLGQKAWHAGVFNGRSIGVEHANTTAKGYATEAQLEESARIFGWLCTTFNVPPRWARGGAGSGVCYHGELGVAGGNHPQCGPDHSGWLHFLDLLAFQMHRGGYRKAWARL